MNRRNLLSILLILCFSLCHAGDKKALIIAIGDYPESGGWPDISSANDVPHVLSSLKHLGFDEADITIVQDAEATKQGILASFASLLESVELGDVVYVHYSGHGQQVMDQNSDELDGFDESLVAYNSPLHFLEGFNEGENLVRDDEIGDFANKIRQKIGANGRLILVLDSCHSGTGTRGFGKSRGTDVKMAPDGYKPVRRAGQESSMEAFADDESYASMISFFGASAKELNFETLDDQDKPVGSLSYALSRTLLSVGDGASYREVFRRVKQLMKSSSPRQSPQCEGNLDLGLLGTSRSMMDINHSVLDKISAVKILVELGTAQEVYQGSSIELYTESDPDQVYTTGKIIQEGLTLSIAALDDPISMDNDVHYYAKLKQKAYPRVRIAIESMLEQGTYSSIQAQIDELSTIRFVESNAELLLTDCDEEHTLQLLTREGDIAYKTTNTDEAVLQENLLSYLSRYAQCKYLKRLQSEISGFDLDIELYETDCDARDLPEGSRKIESGADLPLMSCIKIKVINRGEQDAYFSILDIQPDHYINVLIPSPALPYAAEEYYVGAGEEFVCDFNIMMQEPMGTEVLKLVASRSALDLSSIVTSRGEQARDASFHPFEQLFHSTYPAAQHRGGSVVRTSAEDVHVSSFFFEIVD